ncbi:SGNH/GDSL hydrolase family protein [Saccharothrix syringae]|uniref:SGNH/GDSL hydrolase family protein n=1 Tax=Saccharothrix syringae TaxID=103733 RepID=A0A5Q0GV62_SACSY|nr:SGNH/GDSL hydrolase family protein [Saccharothrix syringae]QFZ17811.1 SGNH/GDSL hydrolase family protein [Saccharothrix syringae]
MTGTDDGWVRSWGASPQAAHDGLGSFDGHPPLADVTLRQVVRISGGGGRVRVRFTNEFGTTPLTIGAARVGLAEPGGGVRAGSERVLTFSGAPGVTVPAGAPVLSDPVDLCLPALAKLSISLHVPGRVETCTCHDPALETGWAIPGDAVAAPALPGDAVPLPVRALLSAVELVPDVPARTVVVVGDSRVDGAGSTPGANRSWPELLAERGVAVHVSNQGISGNRMLNNGIGPAVLARFDRDVLATPGLGYVVLSVGGNDIGISFAPRDASLADFLAMFPGAPVTVDDVIAGYRQLVGRARERGVKVYATTIAPYGGSEIYSLEGESARRAVNEWIRTGGAFDAVLDFDAVWRDPDHPSRIREDFHAGDHLHGNDAGYRALADSVDLSLFG